MKTCIRSVCIVLGSVLLASPLLNADGDDIEVALNKAYDERQYQAIYNVVYGLQNLSLEDQTKVLHWVDGAAVHRANLVLLDATSKLVHDMNNGKLSEELKQNYSGYFSGEDGPERLKVMFTRLKKIYVDLHGGDQDMTSQRQQALTLLERKLYYRFPNLEKEEDTQKMVRPQEDVGEIISDMNDIQVEDVDPFCLDVVRSQWFASIKDKVWGTHHLYYDRENGNVPHKNKSVSSDESTEQRIADMRTVIENALFSHIPHSPSYANVTKLNNEAAGISHEDSKTLRIKIPSENASTLVTPRADIHNQRGKDIDNKELVNLIPWQGNGDDFPSLDQSVSHVSDKASSSGQKKNWGTKSIGGTKRGRKGKGKQGRYGKRYRPVTYKAK